MDQATIQALMTEPTIDAIMEKGIGGNRPKLKKHFSMKIMESALKKAGFKYSWELRKAKKSCSGKCKCNGSHCGK